MKRLIRVCAIASSLSLAVLTTVWAAKPVPPPPTGQLVPNLRALPGSDLSVVRNIATGVPELRFSATTWNAGTGPLELLAGETGAGQQNVYQRLYNGDGTYNDLLAGSFVWHPGHNHFHFEDYAIYSLQLANSPGNSVRTSAKTTFCVMDTGRVDGSLPGSPNRAVYTNCGNQVQGMSVGWGDTYGASLPGQSINLSDWPDGDYKLSIVVDPKQHIVETDETDNSSCLLIHIDMAALTAAPVGGGSCAGGSSTATITSISPASASRGAQIGVTISGSGFVSGMNVTFENGSGATPTVSNVVVQNPQVITAVVSVKKGSSVGTTWDLRVGSAVLQGAFTVLP